jgi:hypothetical protein
MPPQPISRCPLCYRLLSPGETSCIVCRNKDLNRLSNPRVRTPITKTVLERLGRTPLGRTPLVVRPIFNTQTCSACGGSGVIITTESTWERGPDQTITEYVTEYGMGPHGTSRRVPRPRRVPGPMVYRPRTVRVSCSSCGGTGKIR